jgi:hypothetical protein
MNKVFWKKMFWVFLVKKLVLLIIFCFFVSPIFAFEASLEPGVHKVLDSDSNLSKAMGGNFAAMLFMPAENIRYIAAFEFPFLKTDTDSTVESFNLANLNLGVDYKIFELFNRFSFHVGALAGPTGSFIFFTRLQAHYYKLFGDNLKTTSLSSVNANLGVKIFLE